MSNEEEIHTVALQEFRLLTPDADGAVARIVAATYAKGDPYIPMLTSIDDEHDVATVRALSGEQHEDTAVSDMKAALGPYLSLWRRPMRYRPRIAHQSQSPPAYFRLAVTESGISQAGSDTASVPQAASAGPSSDPWLLWIAAPIASHAGLLVLIGEGADERRPAPLEWPLPFSRALGVRIYDNRAETGPVA